MVAQETNLLNAFETTLSTTLGASGTTVTLTAVTDSASNNITAPCYLVIEPDSATNREYVLVSAINIGTKTITLGDGGSDYRYLTGSSATSGLSHASGATIRYVPMAQHIEDINDRVDTIMNSAGTAVNTSGLVKDEDDMSSDSATHLATQQSVKAYVDSQVTAQDLDLISDSGTIDIDLDSESLTVAGGEGIDTSATGTTLTIAGEDATTSNKGVASFSSDNFAVSSGAVTIKAGGVDLTAEVTGTLPVANGGTNISSFTAGDLVYASGSTALSKLAKGTAGQVLAMNSGATAPEWTSDTDTTYTAGDGLDLSSTEFSVDLKSNGGLVIESTEVAVDLGASSITGTLDETDGGTGLTGYTAGDVIYASGTDTLAKLAKGSAGQVLTMNSGATAPEWSSDSDTTYSAGTLLDLATTTFNVDLSEASEAAIADGDYVMFLDGGASGTAAKEAIGDIATLFAGTGLTASSSVIGVDTSQNITALTGGDLTIYEDANNADVSVKMGTSAAESLTIEVLNGGSNKTAEQINFTTATASATANHGKMVFNVDETEIATVDDDGINLASGKTFRVDGTELGGVTASSTTTFTNKTIDADGTGNSISNIDIGNMTSAVVVTESDTIAGNDNDTTLPTSAAVKGYVDAQGFADIGLIIALG